MYKLLFFIKLLILTFSIAGNAQIIFSNTPQNGELFPRNIVSNVAAVKIKGQVPFNLYSSIKVLTYKNNILNDSSIQSLTYINGIADFDFTIMLNAEMSMYNLEIVGVKNNIATIIKTVTGLLAGDAYLINGQSNAFAAELNTYTQALKSPYIVTFGTLNNNNDANWYEADGDNGSISSGIAGNGFIGQWGMKMARMILDYQHFPVAILNEADVVQPISNFARDEANHYNISTNYGRLLTRAQNAGLAEHIRGVFYFQGESDINNAIGHKTGYENLYKNWNEDFPGVEKFYVMQVRDGCGEPSLELRNYQRLFQDKLMNLTTITTNGLTGHDGCHYVYLNGYEELGRNLYRIVAMQLYGSAVNPSYYSVNPDFAYLKANDEIIIKTRNNYENLSWGEGAEKDFSFDPPSLTIISGFVTGNEIHLKLSTHIRSLDEIKTISYGGHRGHEDRWIKNTENMSLMTFDKMKVSYSINEMTISVLPNPSMGTVYVNYNKANSDALFLFDFTGRLVYGQKFSSDLMDKLELSGLAQGVYILKIGEKRFKIILN